MTTAVEALDTTVQKTNLWLKELVEQGHLADEAQAYKALRSVLHALRDRLTIDEAAHLAAQLPMLVRGLYYEGWKPSTNPSKERTKQAFLESVRQNLAGGLVDPAHAVDSVCRLLEHKITGGELQDVKRMLPPEILELWPQP